MTMHMEGPWLSTTGKRKGKQKFRNSSEAKKHRELEENWKALQKKWGMDIEERKRYRALTSAPYVPPPSNHRETSKIPSLPFTAGACVKSEQKIYTGDKIKGIGTLHKSNAVPIFSDEEAIEIARMRR